MLWSTASVSRYRIAYLRKWSPFLPLPWPPCCAYHVFVLYLGKQVDSVHCIAGWSNAYMSWIFSEIPPGISWKSPGNLLSYICRHPVIVLPSEWWWSYAVCDVVFGSRLADLSLAPMPPSASALSAPMSALSAAASVDPYAGMRDAAQRGFSAVRVAAPPPGVAAFGAAGAVAPAAQLVTPGVAATQLYTQYQWLPPMCAAAVAVLAPSCVAAAGCSVDIHPGLSRRVLCRRAC